ncbi:MAG: TetR/AcrR family transcriptional regulator [Alphaproteobacteria bacterium]|nr:TetR/AcrR family transcriptional regulator [Alphaproteobacteria bacterium]
MGRTRGYDADEVLGRAMLTFWRQGYERTSVADLVDATGVARSVLYGEWGDKRGLLLAAIDAYLREVGRPTLMGLEAGGVAAIRSVFDAVAGQITADDAVSCLVLETALAVAPHDEVVAHKVRDALDEVRSRFLQALSSAVQGGTLPPTTDVQAHADHLAISFQALLIQGRTRPGADAVRRFVDLTLRPLELLETTCSPSR